METTPKKRKSHIFLLDGHEAARRGLARLIASEPDLDVCGEASAVEEALGALRAALPDVVVVGSGAAAAAGASAVERLRWEYPSLPLIVVALKEAGGHGRRVMQAGAAAYVMTARAARQIVPVIRRVLKGGTYTGLKERRKPPRTS